MSKKRDNRKTQRRGRASLLGKNHFPVEDGVDEAKIREGLLVGCWMLDGGAVVGLGIFGAKLGGLRWRVGCWTGEGRGGGGGIDGGVGGR